MQNQYLLEIAYRVWYLEWTTDFTLDSNAIDDYEADVTIETMDIFYRMIQEEVDTNKNQPFLCNLDEWLTEKTIYELWRKHLEQLKYDDLSNSVPDFLQSNIRYDSFESFVQTMYDKFNITFVKSWEDKTEWDYEAIASINSEWGYIDVYYTKGKTWILITDWSASSE